MLETRLRNTSTSSSSSSSGTIAIGDSITSATAGSVLFAGVAGVLAQDNANFFWDATNHRLGIGTVSPAVPLDVNGASIFRGAMYLDAPSNYILQGFADRASLRGYNTTDAAYKDILSVVRGSGAGATGSVGIGTATPGNLLHIYKNSSYEALKVESATNGYSYGIFNNGADRMYFGNNNSSGVGVNTGAIANSGAIRSDAGLHLTTGAAATQGITILSTTGNVGIGLTNPATALDVTGSIHTTGTLAVGVANSSIIGAYIRGTYLGDIASGVTLNTSLQATGNNQTVYGLNVGTNLDVSNGGVFTGFVYNGISIGNPSIISGDPGYVRGISLASYTRGTTENTGLYIVSPKGTGANYGIFIADAPSGGTSNYAIYSAGGTNYFGGSVGIGLTVPTAVLHLKAGTATASTAPLKFTSGTVNTTPEAGAMEFDGSALWISFT